MPELAFVNGRILPLDQATVPIEDRGYQFGDAVYEVIASSAGRLFALEEHLDRLERSLGELHFFKDFAEQGALLRRCAQFYYCFTFEAILCQALFFRRRGPGCIERRPERIERIAGCVEVGRVELCNNALHVADFFGVGG